MKSLSPAAAVLLILLLAFPEITGTFVSVVLGPFKNPSPVASPARLLQNDLPGTEPTPPELREALRLAQKHRISTFVLSEGFVNDPPLRRSLIERLYPIKVSPDSPYVFLRISEDVLSGCDILDVSTAVKLANCG